MMSVVMVDGQFREKFHLIDCLNNQTLPRSDYELIWVEFYDDVKEALKSKENVKIVTLGNPKDSKYHSSYCFNEGIRQSRGEILVIPDADILVEEDFLEKVKDEHQTCNQLVIYFNRFNEPAQKHNSTQSYQLDYLKANSSLNYTNNYGACLSVRKNWLIEINGYEQDDTFSSGFHANGFDVYTRLKNLGLHIKWHPKVFLYHPWHPFTESNTNNYESQLSIVNQRSLNLSTLPNYGMDAEKNKLVKEYPVPRKTKKNTNGKLLGRLLRFAKKLWN